MLSDPFHSRSDGKGTKELLSRIVDSNLVVFTNPGYIPGSVGPLAERYARESPAIAQALESAPGYAPTPLYQLDRLADATHCAAILFKDEGHRFELGSFKSVGVVYAMARYIERMFGEQLDPDKTLRGGYAGHLRHKIFATASSGNHGRALAWASRCVGAQCIIYAPAECSEERIKAIERFGAKVVRTGVLYNAAMEQCRRDCDKNGWALFADTSWEDYQEIPTDIMLGYAHIIREIAAQFEDWSAITHIVIQGGVGAFAAGLLTGLAIVDPSARIHAIVVEPRDICALQTSARLRRPSAINIDTMSLMTGISNQEISVSAWPTLDMRTRYFVGLSDTKSR
jgi:diaminopropionate ammonia-lyase